MNALRALPIVGDVRGKGFFWAIELVKDEDDTRLDADERERCCAASCPAGCSRRASSRGPTTAATPSCTSPRRSSATRPSSTRWRRSSSEVLTDADDVLHGRTTA